MSTTDGVVASRAELLDEIEHSQRFLLATHENPDGDALGSLAGMQLVLTALGKDSVAYMAPDEFPLPYEYAFLEVENLVTEPPADLEDRTIVFLDCGNIDRNPADSLKREGAHILNVDHHHDNTHFGTVNHVVPEASCTAEVIWDLMEGLGVRPTQTIAEALYVGLVTDTGKFMYENTGPRAHEMAADLIEVGVDVHAIYRRLFEGVPQGKLELLARGLSNVERFDGGLLTVTHLTRDDYAATSADESYSEGVIDHLRALQGTAMAGLVRDLLNGDPSEPQRRKVSLRATDDRVDVSAIARAQGGGGHRRAAGFSTSMDFPELVEFLRAGLAEQLS
jgi:phosphoesterase RecJ-like protein